MNKIILYGSKYGTTKEYAQEFSKRTNIDILEYSKVKNLENYDLIIYFGGLYAGGILGLKDTINKYPLNNNQKLIVVTVGLADPTVKSNTDDWIGYTLLDKKDKDMLVS